MRDLPDSTPYHVCLAAIEEERLVSDHGDAGITGTPLTRIGGKPALIDDEDETPRRA